MNKKVILVFLALLAVVAVALNGRIGIVTPGAGKVRVTASFYPLYFFAQQIGGDKAMVANVTPYGVEPHDYEPTARDIALFHGSALAILNGGGLEPWGNKVKDVIDPARTTIISAVDDVSDPHAWLSPVLAGKMVDKILAGFVRAYPPDAEYFMSNAATLKVRLEELDREYRVGLNDCAIRDIVTSHSAFGYLAAEYNLNQVAIAGISPDAEPSSTQLAEIAEFAKARKVKYVFFESLVSPKLSETIAYEVGAKTMVLNPIEGLSARDISAGKDYFSEMKSNLINLETALQCRQ